MKTKHIHVIEGTIKIAIPFDPENLETAMQAQSDIQAFARQHCKGPFAPDHEPMQLLDVATRMTKIPAPAETAATITEPMRSDTDNVILVKGDELDIPPFLKKVK